MAVKASNGTIGLTVKVATELVTVPAILLTVTLKVEPLALIDVTGVVKFDAVAPLMGAPFSAH
jgi:hypothetical protein